MSTGKIVPTGLWAGSRWELEDTRRRTLEVLTDLDSAIIDLVPEGFENSVGSLLHHIALIEADWLYADILEQDYPQWMYERFPDEDRDQIGHLVAPEMPIDRHLDTLAFVREELLKELDALADNEFERVRTTDSGELNPLWVLHHLRQHEAEHRGQIQSLRARLEG